MRISLRLWLYFVFSLLAMVLAGCGGHSNQDSQTRFVAVIDAGSSGSRIVLYERRRAGKALLVEQRFSDTAGQALSSFETLPAEAGPMGVAPLIHTLNAYLRASSISIGDVQVHLLATAGMRLLEARNPGAASAIYTSAKSSLASSGLRLGRIETLSGVNEGLYAWLDLNDLAGRLQEGSQATLGIIEVGGASAQIAFATNEDDPRVVTVMANGQSYRVLSQSWLGLGQDQARLSMINRTGPGAGLKDNACYPNNASQAGGLQVFDAGIGGQFIASGSFDFAGCNALYDELLLTLRVREVTRVSGFAGLTLVGASAVSFALSDWQASNDPSALGSQVQRRCTGPDAYGIQVLPFLGRTAPGNRFAQNACANGTFVHALMFGPQGLGIRPDQLRSEVGPGLSVNWTRGVALADS